MFTLPKTFVKVTCLSIALLGATAVVGTMTLPDVAYAKSDKSKGKSKGKGKQNKSASAKVYKGQGNAVALALGVHPSELGNLNAWNNNSDNMNPNSMPGKLALYEELILAGWTVEQAVIDETGTLAGLPFPGTDLSGYALVDANGNTYYDIAAIDADLGGLLPPLTLTNEEYQQILDYNSQVVVLNSAQDSFITYDYGAEETTLDDIANKPISDSLFNTIRDWIISSFTSS